MFGGDRSREVSRAVLCPNCVGERGQEEKRSRRTEDKEKKNKEARRREEGGEMIGPCALAAWLNFWFACSVSSSASPKARPQRMRAAHDLASREGERERRRFIYSFPR